MLGALTGRRDGWLGVCPALSPPTVQVFLKNTVVGAGLQAARLFVWLDGKSSGRQGGRKAFLTQIILRCETA